MVLRIQKNGWTYSELSDEHGAMLLQMGDPKTMGQEFKAFADSHQVQFPQGHLWLACPLCAPDEDMVLRTLESWLDLFYAAGVRRAVLHCDSDSFPEGTSKQTMLETNVDRVRKLARYLSGTDMILCLENLLKITDSVDELLQIIHAVGGPNLGICLDTGHLNLAGHDQADFIHKAAPYLKALHIADNDGSSDQHIMPFGRGKVDFVKVVKSLAQIQYDGVYNFEIGGETGCPLAIRDLKMHYLKAVMKEMEAMVDGL
jgi:hypothetical protein